MKHTITIFALCAAMAACGGNQQTGPADTPVSAADSIVGNIALTSFPDREVSVAPLGDSAACARQLLQGAIDSCSLAGGGRVTVGTGYYRINGPLHLKSNVNLHLQEGAYLQFSGRPADFLPVVLTRWEGTELYGHSPMIYAYHANNVALTGKGTIDAQGGLEFAAWSQRESADRNRLREMGDKLVPVCERVFGQGTLLRPSCIQALGCSRVLIEDITVKDSPFWTIHPVYCDNVIVRGVTIDSHFPNNDGCDPESTCNVLIENCTFRTGDDAVAIKSGRDTDGRSIGRPSENIVIRNCLFHSECNGLCIGSEMSGGVENVHMSHITIGTVKNALYFKSNRDRGGYIRGVDVSHITVEHALGAILRFETNYFGYRGGDHPSRYEHFVISDVEAHLADRYGIFMDGSDVGNIDDILVRRFRVDQAAEAYYLMNTARIAFDSVTVNGHVLPPTPLQSTCHVTLDVY